MARYASNARRPGELSASEAARRIGVHRTTVYTWAKESISGGDSPLGDGEVRRDVKGRYWLDSNAVERLPERLQVDDYI